MVSGACLAFVAAWPVLALLFAGFRSSGDAHGWYSGPGDVCRRASDVHPRARTRSLRCPGGALAKAHPGEDLGHAWHLTSLLVKRTSPVCRGARLAACGKLDELFR